MTALPKRKLPANTGGWLMIACLIIIWACHVAGQDLSEGWLHELTQLTGIASCVACVWGGIMAIHAESDERPSIETSQVRIGRNAIWTD